MSEFGEKPNNTVNYAPAALDAASLRQLLWRYDKGSDMKRCIAALFSLIFMCAEASSIELSDFDTPYFSLESSFNEFQSEHAHEITEISHNVYRFKEYNLYVEAGYISGYEIVAPTSAGFRGIHVGSNESELNAQYSWLMKDETFEREGPYDKDYKDYDYSLAKDYIYDSPDADPNGKARWIIFFIKDSVVSRIFVYQGGMC